MKPLRRHRDPRAAGIATAQVHQHTNLDEILTVSQKQSLCAGIATSRPHRVPSRVLTSLCRRNEASTQALRHANAGRVMSQKRSHLRRHRDRCDIASGRLDDLQSQKQSLCAGIATWDGRQHGMVRPPTTAHRRNEASAQAHSHQRHAEKSTSRHRDQRSHAEEIRGPVAIAETKPLRRHRNTEAINTFSISEQSQKRSLCAGTATPRRPRRRRWTCKPCVAETKPLRRHRNTVSQGSACSRHLCTDIIAMVDEATGYQASRPAGA